MQNTTGMSQKQGGLRGIKKHEHQRESTTSHEKEEGTPRAYIGRSFKRERGTGERTGLLLDEHGEEPRKKVSLNPQEGQKQERIPLKEESTKGWQEI